MLEKKAMHSRESEENILDLSRKITTNLKKKKKKETPPTENKKQKQLDKKKNKL